MRSQREIPDVRARLHGPWRRTAHRIAGPTERRVPLPDGVIEAGMGRRPEEDGCGRDGIGECAQGKHRRVLGGRARADERASPVVVELVVRVAIIGPERARVDDDEVVVRRLAIVVIEAEQVADEDPLEADLVAVAPSAPAGLLQYPVGIREIGERGVGDRFGAREQGRVAGGLVQLGEPSQHDPLVVRPRRLTVVRAHLRVGAGGEPVVDQVRGVDHPAPLEPGPLLLRPIDVAARSAVAGGPVVEAGGDEQEELVRDRVLVGPGSVPPDTAGARGRVPGPDHVGEDRLGGRQVLWVRGEIVSADPGMGPPRFVVVSILCAGHPNELLRVVQVVRGDDHVQEVLPPARKEARLDGFDVVGPRPRRSGSPLAQLGAVHRRERQERRVALRLPVVRGTRFDHRRDRPGVEGGVAGVEGGIGGKGIFGGGLPGIAKVATVPHTPIP